MRLGVKLFSIGCFWLMPFIIEGAGLRVQGALQSHMSGGTVRLAHVEAKALPNKTTRTYPGPPSE